MNVTSREDVGFPVGGEAGAGFAALVFDYRHFGASTGEPRNLVDIGRQHDDWRDPIAPPEPARRAGERAPKGEVRDYDLGHFDIYVGEPFERAVADQVDFLRRHLA